MINHYKRKIMFLSIEDYKTVCDEFELETIEANDIFREQAEYAAIEQINSYCNARYDMAKEWAKTGGERNSMLIQCTVNIALWLMIHRLPQSMGHERRECLYEDSIKWLKDVQASKARPSFATYDTEDETDAHNPVAYGQQKRVTCTW